MHEQLMGGSQDDGRLSYTQVETVGLGGVGKTALALAIAKEMLGQIRSKFSTVPIPGESINLNGDALLSQAKEEQASLKEELKTILNETTYDKLSETTAGMMESTSKVLEKFPLKIFIG